VARRKKKISPILAVSLGVHLAVGAALALIPQEALREVVAIAMNEAPKPDKKPEPPKPPAHAAEHPAVRNTNHAPRSAPAPQAAAASPTQGAAFTDLGLTLDSSSSDGLAVNIAPVAPKSAAVAAPAASLMKPKVLVARKTESECTEAILKARPLGVVRPAYTAEARRARIEGRVRVELSVNEQGEVTEARVVESLGYGLDEAAVAAAKNLHFAAATRCGRPIAAPFVIAMRFLLGT
jgi:protein TonB